jgi:hypothetical protein
MAVTDEQFEQLLLSQLRQTAEAVTAQILEGVAFSRANDVGDAAIQQQLLDQWATGQGGVEKIVQKARSLLNGSVNRIYVAQQRAIIRDKDPDKEQGLYMWEATGSKTCPTCIDRHGEIRSWAEWESRGLPGAGTTICTFHCRCQLIRLKAALRKYGAKTPTKLTKKAREPIMDRLDEIKRLEKLRGAKFAESTRINKLQNFRATESALSSVPGASPLAANKLGRIKKLSKELADTGKLDSIKNLPAAQRNALESGVKIFDARIESKRRERATALRRAG